MIETLIYGGSFNPPTNAHTEIINACLTRDPLAEVWVIPSGTRADKTLTMPPEHRKGLLDAAVQAIQNERIRIDTSELHDEATRTCNTVRRLNNQYPDRQFRYVFGSDSYQAMPRWFNGEELRATLPMIIVPRLGSIAVLQDSKAELMEVETPYVSSTMVRERRANNQDIAHLVCDEVLGYIQAHKLYSEQPAMS